MADLSIIKSLRIAGGFFVFLAAITAAIPGE
jgi:small neutral amino acid transporter SnatA (MarC family)